MNSDLIMNLCTTWRYLREFQTIGYFKDLALRGKGAQKDTIWPSKGAPEDTIWPSKGGPKVHLG